VHLEEARRARGAGGGGRGGGGGEGASGRCLLYNFIKRQQQLILPTPGNLPSFLPTLPCGNAYLLRCLRRLRLSRLMRFFFHCGKTLVLSATACTPRRIRHA